MSLIGVGETLIDGKARRIEENQRFNLSFLSFPAKAAQREAFAAPYFVSRFFPSTQATTM
jgi:hypothetical protein